jgi:maternal DNA replication licensing factor mcm3
MENIGLQDSLLSRFDLLFILIDKHDRELDQQIADHVVRMHRYRAPNEEDGERKFNHNKYNQKQYSCF